MGAEDPTETDLIGELLADSGNRAIGCLACAWLKDRDDKDQWQAAMENPAISTAAIVRGMKARGFPYSKPPSTHRAEKHRVG